MIICTLPLLTVYGCCCDDCSQAYLTDRTTQKHYMIYWYGASESTSAVFWKSNDVFILVGYNHANLPMHAVKVYDLKNFTLDVYHTPDDNPCHERDYFLNVYLPEKGVIVDKD